MFLCATADLAGDVVVLGGSEGRHAATVRRLGPGERVDLSDGSGLMAECVVTAARAGALELVVRSRRSQPRPDLTLVVAQALPKGDRGQLAVELMTEAGVDAIVPWAAQHCVTRWEGERGARSAQRWQATAREAAKQARRAWLPEVAPLVSTAGLLTRVAQARLAVLLDPAGQVALAHLPVPASGEIVVVVGPEGGVSPTETGALVAAGAVRACLGPTVLRTSSAGVVAAAVLLSRTGRWDTPLAAGQS
ncbi:MAG TPA: 16S rRNA (uracil(1498)-N(3))-methyltransferase [Streptosporangiaceae bacterium]|nr:16S rRNA (uracil(1498)-N(3))-methyltransferase [Streptosporangiaceae bacterium]